MRARTLGAAGIVCALAAIGSCGGNAVGTKSASAPTAPNAKSAAVAPTSFVPAVPLAMGGAPLTETSPPASLTTTDGTGLSMVAVFARAVVDDPLAFTELHFTFENPENRILEGRFHVALPKDAALSRLALKIDGAFQEGEVVEKEQARVAYEDALHFRRDPALLEQAAGNEYDVRVFPIRPHEKKEIIVSYTQSVTNGPYVLPLKGLPQVGSLHVEAARAGDQKPAQTLDLASAAPNEDFVLPRRDGAPLAGLRAGDFAVMRVKAMFPETPDALSRVVVLVDTSASRALGLSHELVALANVAAGAPEARLVIAAFDQEVEPIFDGLAKDLSSAVLERVAQRGALGASDITRALAWAKDAAKSSGATRVILLTDGVATAGSAKPDALVHAARELRDGGVERVDAIAIGGIRDEDALAHLVTAGLVRDGVVVDGARPREEIAHRLSTAPKTNVAVAIPSARWVYPARIDGLVSGDETTVYAEVPADAPIAVSLGDAAAARVEMRSADRPLLERALAQAHIASMLERAARGENVPNLRNDVVDLAVRHRVMSPYTSLVVLESEADYQRFGIARRGLADVLDIDGGRVVVRKRVLERLPPKAGADFGLVGLTAPGANTAPDAHTTPDAPADEQSARGNMWGDAIGDSFGAGGLGLAGVGEGGGGRGEGIGLGNVGTLGHGAGTGNGSTGTGQGFGAGHGRLGGAHATRAPTVREGSTQVNGRIAPEVISRIVRQNFGRLRLCYDNGLRRNSSLAGRVVVRFVIARDGTVSLVSDGGSDISDADVVSCALRVFSSMQFPTPDGGVVTVNYPIVFAPEGWVPPPASNVQAPQTAQRVQPAQPSYADPYEGKLKDVMEAIARGSTSDALTKAAAWRRESPGDVLALVALGEALEKSGDTRTAARAYGSIIDLFSARADLRRFAGARLERVGGAPALALAADSFAKAAEDRPDHPSSHRLLAYARVRQNDFAGAFDAIENGLRRSYPVGRFAGVDRILREDAGILAAAWIAADPKRAQEIESRARAIGATVDREPSLRFVLNWETDANDVDFHIYDADGGHAFYGARALPSGGELYADVTTGYGPECFGIRGPKSQRRGPYHLMAHYYSRGPMGYGMGKVEAVEHDGKGNLRFDERPFLVMKDRAFVDLGEF
jgi:hypothetical protein